MWFPSQLGEDGLSGAALGGVIGFLVNNAAMSLDCLPMFRADGLWDRFYSCHPLPPSWARWRIYSTSPQRHGSLLRLPTLGLLG